MGWTDDAGAEEGGHRFEDIALLLPDEEYQYGERGIGTRQSGKRPKEVRNYEIKEDPSSISRMGRPISKKPSIF